MSDLLYYDNGHTPIKESSLLSVPTSCNLKYNNFSATKLNSSFLHSHNGVTNIGSTAGLPNLDLIQAKIEHLEKERVDLTLQLHRRNEKDRERKIKLDQAESKVKDLEIVNSKLANSLHALQYDCTTLKLDKEELQLEVSRRRKEADSGAHFEALELWNKMSAATLEIKRIETEMVQLRLEKATLQKEKTDLVEQLEKSAKRNETLERERKDMIAYKSELDESTIRIANLQKIESKLEQEVRELKRELTGATENLVSEVSRLKEENANFKSLNDSLSTALDKLTYEKNDNILISMDEYSLYQSQVVQSKSTQAALFESERRRRELHNKLQDIRGNIRVFVRCRPFLEADVLEEIRAGVRDANVNNMQPCLTFLKDESSICIAPTALGYLSSSLRNTKGMLGSANQPFVFDKTFGKDASQGDVYNEVSELVQSALDGYRVCILSYGQSGSGKTHTMTGCDKKDQQGIIPRSVMNILNHVRVMKSMGWAEVAVKVSIVELYNEELHDLLEDCTSGRDRSSSASHTTNLSKKFKINNSNNCVSVSGLTEVTIDTSDCSLGMSQFADLLSQSAAARTTASTGMNEVSSRSHLIVMIEIQGRHSDGVTVMQGGLRLCDLAGSERLDRTGNLNDATRLKESVNINKSLSCLSDVLLALHSKAKHIPYRNSKLTMLLQDCLSGDGKTLMFVNVSPTIASVQETLCSLRFASQASQIELGKANKHVYTIVQQPAVQSSLQLQTQSMDSVHPSPPSWSAAPSVHLATEKSSSRRASLISSGTYTQIVSAASAQGSKCVRKSLDVGSNRPFSKDYNQRLESIDEATPSKEKECSSPSQGPLHAIAFDMVDYDSSSNNDHSSVNVLPHVHIDERPTVLRSMSADHTNRKATTTAEGRRPTIISGNIASKRSSISGNISFSQQQPVVKRKRIELHDSPSSKENFIDHVILTGPVGTLTNTTTTATSALHLGAARRLEKVTTQLNTSLDQLPINYPSSRKSKAIWRQ
eukprot:gene24355-32797_t